jgi:fido (protein-threonine AMPylation protein)
MKCPIFTEPEGATPLEPDEIEGLVHTHIETRDELNALENANIADCLVWLSSQSTLSLKEILSLNFARILHEEMFSRVWSWAGNFRTTDKNIGCDTWQIRIITNRWIAIL